MCSRSRCGVSVGRVAEPVSGRVVVVDGPHSRDHRTPTGHVESIERVDAVHRGIAAVDGLEVVMGRLADDAELELVHPREHIDHVRGMSESGGGRIDQDTFVSAGTHAAACGAAGAGLVALERLQADPALAAAFVVSRPPGHHATATAAMGFCFFNNVAIAAAQLARNGQRVVILDWDAHHGNGTQEIFWADDRVLFVSMHQEILYPGTGHLHERGPMAGHLTTVNLPLPAGTTGDHYLRLLDELVTPVVARFEPDWVLVSCGFDAHVDDPLSQMGLHADDFGLLTARAAAWAPRPGRAVFFLEGGYDLHAVEESTAAVLSTLTGVRTTEPSPTSGGPGEIRVAELLRFWS